MRVEKISNMFSIQIDYKLNWVKWRLDSIGNVSLFILGTSDNVTSNSVLSNPANLFIVKVT